MCKVEDDQEPEATYGRHYYQIPQTCNRRKKLHAEAYCRNAYPSSENHREKEEQEVHPTRTCNTHECVIWEARTRKCQREIDFPMFVYELLGFLQVVFAHKLQYDSVTAEPTERIHEERGKVDTYRTHHERFPTRAEQCNRNTYHRSTCSRYKA